MPQTPDQCLFVGLCGVQRAVEAVPPGVMFAAVGLVLIGLFGLRYTRRHRR